MIKKSRYYSVVKGLTFQLHVSVTHEWVAQQRMLCVEEEGVKYPTFPPLSDEERAYFLQQVRSHFFLKNLNKRTPNIPTNKMLSKNGSMRTISDFRRMNML
jgi:hypothetical protein